MFKVLNTLKRIHRPWRHRCGEWQLWWLSSYWGVFWWGPWWRTWWPCWPAPGRYRRVSWCPWRWSGPLTLRSVQTSYEITFCFWNNFLNFFSPDECQKWRLQHIRLHWGLFVITKTPEHGILKQHFVSEVMKGNIYQQKPHYESSCWNGIEEIK